MSVSSVGKKVILVAILAETSAVIQNIGTLIEDGFNTTSVNKMKKRHTIKEYSEDSIYNVEGDIDDAIQKLLEYKEKGWQRINFSSNDYDYIVKLFKTRPENDQEYNARLDEEKRKKERLKKLKEDSKAERQKMYEKLKKEFEK